MEDKELFIKYMKAFMEENSRVNLISKNDEKFLWEKHVCDSLAIGRFFEKFGRPASMLDIGTGGGFPAVPVAICYPEIQITAVDSIAKKIRAIQILKDELGLENLTPVCARVENIEGTFDLVTSRAVSSLKKICGYAMPKLKKDGYFAAYKSRKTPEEIEEAKQVLRKYKAKIIDIIEYRLPLKEEHTRNLIIIRKG